MLEYMEVEEGAVENCFGSSSMDQSKLEFKLMKPCSSPPAAGGLKEPENSQSSFDCNICLEFPTDPVVTFCGHLYCWPCIYKYLSVSGDESQHGCPVCKAPLSDSRILPLYGVGANNSTSTPALIPRRPPNQETLSGGDGANVGVRGGLYLLPTETSVFDSMAGGVLKGIADSMLLWLFSNQEATTAGVQSHHHHRNPRAYHPPASSGRLRMREVQAYYVLNQLLSFLSICAFLCFLLF